MPLRPRSKVLYRGNQAGISAKWGEILIESNAEQPTPTPLCGTDLRVGPLNSRHGTFSDAGDNAIRKAMREPSNQRDELSFRRKRNLSLSSPASADNGPGDVFRRLLETRVANRLRLDLSGRVEETGLRRAGRDQNAIHTAATKFKAKRSTQCGQRRLGRRIDGHPRHRLDRDDRGDIHDLAAAPGKHVREYTLDERQRSLKIGRQHPPPIFIGQACEGPVACPAGIVHQHVDSPESGADRGHRSAPLVRIGHIRANGFDSILSQRRPQLLEFPSGPGYHRHATSGVMKFHSAGPPDSAGAAGDQDDAVLKVEGLQVGSLAARFGGRLQASSV